MRMIDADGIKLPSDLPYKASVRRVLAMAPTVDTVSKGLYDQIKWERDVAIDQLTSYGVSLGEKAELAPVKHGRWDRTNRLGEFDRYNAHCSNCGYEVSACGWSWEWKTPYCPNCGAKMDLEG